MKHKLMQLMRLLWSCICVETIALASGVVWLLMIGQPVVALSIFLFIEGYHAAQRRRSGSNRDED